jgi:hypothetical protein
MLLSIASPIPEAVMRTLYLANSPYHCMLKRRMKRKAWDRDESLGVATLVVVILMVLTALYAPQIRSNLALMQPEVAEKEVRDFGAREGDAFLPVELASTRRKPVAGRPESLSAVAEGAPRPVPEAPGNPMAIVPARRTSIPGTSGGSTGGSRVIPGGSGERIARGAKDDPSPRENEEPWPLHGLWRSDEESELGQTLFIEFLRDGRIRTFVGRAGEGIIDPYARFTLEGNTLTITRTGPDGEILQEFRGTVSGSLIQGVEGPAGQMTRPAVFERVE